MDNAYRKMKEKSKAILPELLVIFLPDNQYRGLGEMVFLVVVICLFNDYLPGDHSLVCYQLQIINTCRIFIEVDLF